MKVIFKFSLPIVEKGYDTLKWYKRDAKRIKKGIDWDSGIYMVSDGKYLISIINKHKLPDVYVVEMIKNDTTGRTRVIPIGKVAKIKLYGDDSYIYTLIHL